MEKLHLRKQNDGDNGHKYFTNNRIYVNFLRHYYIIIMIPVTLKFIATIIASIFCYSNYKDLGGKNQ